jgi:hypothetical protein
VALGGVAAAVLAAALVVISGSGSSPGDGPDRSGGGAVADLRREEPGSFEPGEPIPVTLREGDVSFLLTAVADDATEFPAITSVTDPDGVVIYELGDDLEVGGDLTTAALWDEGEVSLLAPAHPGLDVRPGTYEVLVDLPVDVTVVIKSGEVGAQVPQLIDLNLWLASSDLDADTLEAEVRPRIERVLRTQNLAVGRVEVVDADPADAERFAEIDGDTQVTDVCGAVAADVGDSRSLDLAIVESIDDGETLGISSGLPGSTSAPGASRTCTIAATRDVSLDTLAATIVHEGSHFMGLAHTTEEDGSAVDSFADTPECDVDTYDGRDNLGVPGTPDGLVDETECGYEGAGANYMFPSSSGVLEQTDMSADQAWALRRHPLVYPAA